MDESLWAWGKGELFNELEVLFDYPVHMYEFGYKVLVFIVIV